MTHIALLRLSLLASLGIAASACGGSTLREEGDTASEDESNAPGDQPPHAAPDEMAPTCTAPEIDAATGLTACAEGYSHRPEPASCGGTGCQTDSDCPAGSICTCDAPSSPGTGQCTPSDCAVDSDCAPGYRCATHYRIWGSPLSVPPLLHCQTSQDTCVSDSDCQAPEVCGLRSIDGEQARGCGPSTCTGCGRPFLVDAKPRLAPVVFRNDWLI